MIKEIMTIQEMRELLNMSRARFSREYQIPLRTLENWESGARKAPEYVLRLLERAVCEDAKKNRTERLVRMAKEFEDSQQFIDNVGYEEWMDEFLVEKGLEAPVDGEPLTEIQTNMIDDELRRIFTLSKEEV